MNYFVSHRYHETDKIPRPLSEAETIEVITILQSLISDGYAGRDLCHAIRSITKQ